MILCLEVRLIIYIIQNYITAYHWKLWIELRSISNSNGLVGYHGSPTDNVQRSKDYKTRIQGHPTKSGFN